MPKWRIRRFVRLVFIHLIRKEHETQNTSNICRKSRSFVPNGVSPHEWMPPTANDYANALLHVARLPNSQKFQNI